MDLRSCFLSIYPSPDYWYTTNTGTTLLGAASHCFVSPIDSHPSPSR